MYMYKPQYKNNKLILDDSSKNNMKQTLTNIGYAMIPSVFIAIPFLLGK